MRTLAAFALLVTLALGGCTSGGSTPAEPCPSCKATRAEPEGTCDSCGAIITVIAGAGEVDEGY